MVSLFVVLMEGPIMVLVLQKTSWHSSEPGIPSLSQSAAALRLLRYQPCCLLLTGSGSGNRSCLKPTQHQTDSELLHPP